VLRLVDERDLLGLKRLSRHAPGDPEMLSRLGLTARDSTCSMRCRAAVDVPATDVQSDLRRQLGVSATSAACSPPSRARLVVRRPIKTTRQILVALTAQAWLIREP